VYGIKIFFKGKHPVFLILLVVISIVACQDDSKIKSEIADLPVNLKISRFDKMLIGANAESLPDLKKAFPFLFNSRTPDSIWIQKFEDSLQQELVKEVNTVFKDFESVETDLGNFYRHLNYYQPEYQVPEIITLINDVDYRNKLIVTDSLVLIALDAYLGKDHRYYENISRFITKNMIPDQIVSDLAESYAEASIRQPLPKTFLEEMIYQGKLLYYKDVMIPFKKDHSKIGYTPEELQWAAANEASIWTYFVEKELLFSTDPKLNTRFINPAPYSKFYLELDNESPGRIGVYMGWQIVRAYAERSGDDLMAVMVKPADELFQESKFKPRK
jgi:gliding motility-associated lipoprotein GldB